MHAFPRALAVSLSLPLTLASTAPAPAAQAGRPTPLRQADTASVEAAPLTLRDASRDDRWLGLGVRDVRWAADGSGVYFRWNEDPAPGDVEDEDPWFRVDRDGARVEEVPPAEARSIPSGGVAWSADGRRAAWISGGSLYLYDRGAVTRLVTLERPVQAPRFAAEGAAIDFEVGEALYRHGIDDGSLTVLAARATRDGEERATEAAAWLERQQRQLFEHVRRQAERRERTAAARREADPPPQPLPVAAGESVDDIRLSPDGRFVTFHARRRAGERPPTQYVDYVDASGYAEVHDARSKVGEPRDRVRLGVVAVDPTVPADEVEVRWLEPAEAGDQDTVPHGPWWNLEGTRAVAVFMGEDHRDMWLAELDLETGATRVLTHDHDDAWIGGPPVQAGRLQPPLLEWLPGDRLVFASERSGWSHLWLMEPDGAVRPLTEGDWEVREAALSRDRGTWLLQASREHPAEDHLYAMPAAGGELTRLTRAPGGHSGLLSPDGERLAVVFGDSVHLPDLFVGPADVPFPGPGDTSDTAAPQRGVRAPSAGIDGGAPLVVGADGEVGAAALTPSGAGWARAPGEQATTASGPWVRVTVSGNDAFRRHPLVRPEIVSFDHPDGGPLWAALFVPDEPHPERAAIMHIHGGGYRQFAHRGWTVYGWALHLGFINTMVQQGYAVLDFDYRGSAGYGRDYRTDVAGAMGVSDVDGAVAAARWLADERGIDATRIGIYGVSYGGFMTLMAQFRYPGVFAAGIARAAVTDWAHYSDGWTSRILGVPHEAPEAYERSSPIYHAEGLQDALLITHGLVDDNVHFQDAARLIQRLIELEKEFEVMVYPVEPHTIETEASRYDYVRRATAFFDEHLLGR